MKRWCCSLLLLAASCMPEEVGEISVCAASDFDADKRSCRSNARDGTITSGEVFCVLPVEKRKGQKVRGSFFYLDDEVLNAEQDVTSDSGSLTFRYSRLGVSLLPGGSWRCEMTVGDDKRTAGFNSGAEAGPILDAKVCPTSAANWESDVRFCVEDMSADGFPDTNEVTCSATVAGAKGKTVRSVLMRGGSIVESSEGGDPGIQLTQYAKHFATDDDSAFGPGNYSCRFRVDDVTVLEKNFTLHPR